MAKQYFDDRPGEVLRELVRDVNKENKLRGTLASMRADLEALKARVALLEAETYHGGEK